MACLAPEDPHWRRAEGVAGRALPARSRYFTGAELINLVEPASIIALIALGGSGVAALWQIATATGKFEAKTTAILGAMQAMIQDHEDRLRHIERRNPL